MAAGSPNPMLDESLSVLLCHQDSLHWNGDEAHYFGICPSQAQVTPASCYTFRVLTGAVINIQMFPSSNNGNDPIFYSDQRQPFHNRPLFGDNITLNSKLAEPPPPPSFFHLPSPFIPYHELELELELEEREAIFQHSHDPLLHQQQPLRGINSIVSETIANMVDSSKNEVSDLTKICNNISQINSSHITRKRSSKRDRHSKINTAQGPRDRRMRLSLKVARDFFDLQDKLGFDKPSKTVEWLLIQAKHEISKLSSGYSCSTVIGTKSASSTSECEVVSGIDDAPMKESATKGNPSLSVKKEKKTRASRKTAFHPLARESRDKARARARERTKEKMLTRKNDEPKPCEEATNHELHQLGSWSPFETGEESGTQSHNLNPSVDVTTEVDAPSSHEQQQFGTTEDMIDDTLAIVSKWSPPYSIFNNNNGISQEHYHFTDLHSIFKTLEAYNNIQSLR